LFSLQARHLLDKAEPFLVADEEWRVTALLTALRTVEVIPDFSLLPVAGLLKDNLDELVSLLLSSPVPRWSVWLPLMGWLLERIENLPFAVQVEAVRLMDIWQQKAPKGAVYRKEIGTIALAWLKQIEGWSDDAEATEDSMDDGDEDGEAPWDYFPPDLV
jgi:hypothetical protein